MTPADSDDIARAVSVLRGGGLVALPTETVYGLGADASDDGAVRRIFAVKGRPSDHPLIVHIGSVSQIDEWAVHVPDAARILAAAFWPGPLTILLEKAPGVPDVVTGGRPTVALRMPDHPVALAVLRAFGGGVAAPSANRFGRVSPTTAGHVIADLGDDLDLVLDGGPCEIGVESTIVDLTGATPEVLRVGAITVEDLSSTLGVEVALDRSIDVTAAPSSGARAPGMLASHYSPDAKVHVVEERDVVAILRSLLEDDGGIVGLLAPRFIEGIPDAVVELEPAGPPDEYASVLYDRLRQADRLGFAHLVCIPPPPVDIGVAVRDRLARAASD